MPGQANPTIIDIEASGLSSMSYPIEVGVVMGNGEKYCSLIIPAPDWTHWDDEAHKVHGIPREMLYTHGKPPEVVAAQLNEQLKGKTVYSDAWVVDKPWLITLFHAANVAMEFQISPLEAILSESQMARWHDIKDQVISDSGVARHRASNDAWIIQETYKRTLLASE